MTSRENFPSKVREPLFRPSRTESDREAGRADYNARCSGCHSAGSDDPTGFAGDLAGTGSLLVPNLGSIDSSMSGLVLTEQEIADLAAYLDSL